MSNRLTIEDLTSRNIGDLVTTPTDQIAMLAEDIAAIEAKTKAAKAKLTALVKEKFAADLAGHALGTRRIKSEGIDVVVNLPKRVDWDNDVLSKIETHVDGFGKPIWSYFKIERSIPEAIFDSLDDQAAKLVAAARTVKAGSMTVKFERKE